MAQYTNSTLNSNDWELCFQLSSYSKCLVVLVILFYGLRIQLQKLNQQLNVNLIKEFKEGVVHMIVTVMNWCAYMQDYDDVSKMYYYSVIESLCKLVRSIQQGQRTTLISLARIIQDQKEEIEKYQTLLELPREMRQLRLGIEMKMEQLKKHVNTHLERLDKKTTSVTISEVRSQIHRLENTMEDHLGHIPEPDNPSWVFPGDIVHLNAPDDYTIFHDQRNDETPLNR